MIATASYLQATALSPLGRWQARFKLPALFVLVFAFAAVVKPSLLPALPVLAAAIWFLSGLPLAYLFARLRLPGFFLLFMVIVLPFWSGETVLWQIGPLALRQEGLLSLLVIIIKFISIFTVVVALFATTQFSGITVALKALGIPWLLTDLLLFTYRYIFQLIGDLKQMRTAARLRGYRGASIRALKPLANIIGTMLVRSHEQSEKVARAMALRGYGNNSLPLSLCAPRLYDYFLLTVVLITAVFLFILQYVIL